MDVEYRYPVTYQNRKIGPLVVAVVAVLVFLGVFFWVKSHSYIAVVVSGLSAGQANVTITNQATGAVKQSKTSTGTLKELVGDGEYEVVVQQDGKSFYAYSKGSGFLKTVTVEGSVSRESSRTFVGNNPSRCMNYTGQLLVSFDCGALLSQMKIHLPATASQPTTVINEPAGAQNVLAMGSAQTRAGDLLLARTAGSGGHYQLYVILPGGSVSLAEDLSMLNPDSSYQIKPFGQGFVIFSDALENSFKDIYYYSELHGAPTKIQLTTRLNGYQVYTYGISGSSIVVGYTNQEESATAVRRATSRPSYRFAVYSNGVTRVYESPMPYSKVLPCGSGQLCGLSDKKVDILEASGDTLRRLYSINDVLDIQSLNRTLLIFRQHRVISLSVALRTGYSDYSFGGYSFCGYGEAQRGYIVCLTNSLGKNVTLLVNTSAPDKNSIDKKVAALLKFRGIQDVSAYGKYIYVSPRLGDVVYDPATGGFDYDSTTRKTVNAAIAAEIHKLGINTSEFTVVNPFNY